MRTVNGALKLWILKHPFVLVSYIETNIAGELVPPSSELIYPTMVGTCLPIYTTS
jgi:hypothetical protein